MRKLNEEMIERHLGKDLIYDEEVGVLILDWKMTVERRSGYTPFSMFYVASQSENGELVVQEAAKILGVSADDVVETRVEPGQGDVVRNLMALADEIGAKKGDRVMLIVRGFVDLVAGRHEIDLIRLGHDYDQNVKEATDRTPWGIRYCNLGKQVIIITVIGGGLGVEIYNKAVVSAVSSQFKDGILEVR